MTSVHAQSSEQPTPSVWAWEVSSKSRTIYLLGELHYFIGVAGMNISHELGKDIYELSNKVWTETQQIIPDNPPSANKISQQVTAETWNKIEPAVKGVIDHFRNKPTSEKEFLLRRFMNEFNRNDPITAYANLGIVSSFKLQRDRPDFLSYSGLIATLNQLEKQNSRRKLSELEKNTTISDMWWKHCDTKEKAEVMITAGLQKLDPSYAFENDLSKNIQTIFLRSGSDLTDIMNAHLSIDEGPVLLECTVTPRNHAWLPRLLEALESSGPPISFLVGIGHIGGEEGLLALLKANGHTNIKRIFSVKQ